MALTIMGSDPLMQLFCRSLLITFLHYILLLLGGRWGGEGLIGHFTAVVSGCLSHPVVEGMDPVQGSSMFHHSLPWPWPLRWRQSCTP